MDAGEYVPDEVTNLMVRDRIDEPDAEPGFLLDGYPRTLAAGRGARGMIAFTGHRLDAVVVLTVDPDGDRRSGCSQRARGRGPRRRHRGRHPAPPGGLPEQTEPLIGVYRERGSSTRSTAWARSTRSPSGSSRRSTSYLRADRTADGTSRPRAGDQDAGADRPDARGRSARRRDARAARAAPPRRGSPPASSTRSPRTTSAPTAASRRSWATATRLPGHDLRLGQRRGRPRHPRARACSSTAT